MQLSSDGRDSEQATIGWQNNSGSQGTELVTVGEGFVSIALLGKQKHFPVTIFLGLASHPKMVKLLGH